MIIFIQTEIAEMFPKKNGKLESTNIHNSHSDYNSNSNFDDNLQFLKA